MLSVARIPFYSIKTFYFRQVLTCFITKGSLQTRLTYNRGCFTKSGWLTNEGGLQTKVAYKRRWLTNEGGFHCFVQILIGFPTTLKLRVIVQKIRKKYFWMMLMVPEVMMLLSSG